MLTRMVNEGSLPISSLDFVFRCTTLDTKDLVVVLPLALLQLEFCLLKQLAVFVVAAVRPETQFKWNRYRKLANLLNS